MVEFNIILPDDYLEYRAWSPHFFVKRACMKTNVVFNFGTINHILFSMDLVIFLYFKVAMITNFIFYFFL